MSPLLYFVLGAVTALLAYCGWIYITFRDFTEDDDDA